MSKCTSTTSPFFHLRAMLRFMNISMTVRLRMNGFLIVGVRIQITGKYIAAYPAGDTEFHGEVLIALRYFQADVAIPGIAGFLFQQNLFLGWKDKGSRIPDRSSRHTHIPVMTNEITFGTIAAVFSVRLNSVQFYGIPDREEKVSDGSLPVFFR